MRVVLAFAIAPVLGFVLLVPLVAAFHGFAAALVGGLLVGTLVLLQAPVWFVMHRCIDACVEEPAGD